jgi:hypothetical protein
MLPIVPYLTDIVVPSAKAEFAAVLLAKRSRHRGGHQASRWVRTENLRVRGFATD